MITERSIHKEVDLLDSVDEVWNAWTTSEGTKTFFSPDSDIQLYIGGKYEIYFLLNEPYGSRGSEGCKILSYIPYEMLSFSWNAPPHFPKIRNEKTWVVLQFYPKGQNETHLILNHLGWKDGDDWNKTYNYFLNAWDIVLNRLKKRFEFGPIDWSKNKYE